MKFGVCFTVVVFSLIFIPGGFSCNGNDAGTAAENVVFYFPEKNIYYDSMKSNYYYSLDGARSWDSMSVLQNINGALQGPKVPIERTGENIWANNESHRKEYGGRLLNIVNNQTISLSKADSLKKSRAIAKIKNQQVDIEEEAPPKKGLKKFFNNLFGKKKKPRENKQ